MSHNTLQHFTDADYKRKFADSKPVLVDFYADWCPPCRALAPAIEHLADDYAGRASVGKVNVDENPAVARDYQISALPTVLILKDGEVVEKLVGAHPQERYAALLDRALAG